MASYNPLDPDGDPFRPPAIPTLVACLPCGEEYDSYRIEWRVAPDANGRPHGFWCCPVAGCDGKGFGFDILPVDPDYQDERGGWVTDAGDDEEAEAEAFPDDPGPLGESSGDEDETIPW